DLSWTLGREPCEAIAITSDTKGVDHACPSCHHHVRQAWEGRRTRQGHGRPLPCCAAGTRLPAVRDLSECPEPRQARRARALGRPSGARHARAAQRHSAATRDTSRSPRRWYPTPRRLYVQPHQVAQRALEPPALCRPCTTL